MGRNRSTAYCWLVWMRGAFGTSFDWIAPCRTRLERPADYALYRDAEQPGSGEAEVA